MNILFVSITLQQMSKLVTDHMQSKGIEFLWQHTPQKVEQIQDGRLEMTWKDSDGKSGQDTYNTVMFAIGNP